MSYSSLYGIKKDSTGVEIFQYSNSWLFSPIAWDVLSDKYIPLLVQTSFGYKKSLVSDFDGSLFKALNNKINNCKNISDRICWELSNQQVFFVKDKKFVADSIRKFLLDNNEYNKDKEEGIPSLKRENIIERFNQIANDIETLDENEYEYFVFKNSSCDDNVEYWFLKYDEELDDSVEVPFSELDSFVTEFVIIENNDIKDFISNVEFFKK